MAKCMMEHGPPSPHDEHERAARLVDAAKGSKVLGSNLGSEWAWLCHQAPPELKAATFVTMRRQALEREAAALVARKAAKAARKAARAAEKAAEMKAAVEAAAKRRAARAARAKRAGMVGGVLRGLLPLTLPRAASPSWRKKSWAAKIAAKIRKTRVRLAWRVTLCLVQARARA